MSIPVELEALVDHVRRRTMTPYLLTTADDARPHTTAIALRWEGATLVGPCGRTSARNATDRSAVSVLWPPDEPGGYSLIVDADARVETTGSARLARLTPTHAILHRPAEVADPATDCAHDCRTIL